MLRALADRPGAPGPCQAATIDEVWAAATLFGALLRDLR